MNPGSPASQASVLIQPRLRALQDTLLAKTLNPIAPKTEEAIINTLISLKGDGLKEFTLRQINYKLRELARNVNIDDPEAVKHYIATAKNQTTNEQLSDETRNKFAYAYDTYCKKQNMAWQRPWYKVKETVPLIPTSENVNAILNNASKRYTAIFTLLIETGAEGHELENVTQEEYEKRIMKKVKIK